MTPAGLCLFFPRRIFINSLFRREFSLVIPAAPAFFRRSGGKPRLQALPLCADIGNPAGARRFFPRRFRKILYVAAGRETPRGKKFEPFCAAPPFICFSLTPAGKNILGKEHQKKHLEKNLKDISKKEHLKNISKTDEMIFGRLYTPPPRLHFPAASITNYAL